MEPIVEQRGTYKFTWKENIVQLIVYMPTTMLTMNLLDYYFRGRTEFDIGEIQYLAILAVLSSIVTVVIWIRSGRFEYLTVGKK